MPVTPGFITNPNGAFGLPDIDDPGPIELGRVDTEVLSMAVTTTLTDIPTFLKTVTVRDNNRSIDITFNIPVANTGASGSGRFRYAILDGSSTIALYDSATVALSSASGSPSIRFNIVLTPGDHTIKVQAATISVTSGTLSSGATFPANFSIREAV